MWPSDCDGVYQGQQAHLRHQAPVEQALGKEGKYLWIERHMSIGRRHENGQDKEPDACRAALPREEQSNRPHDFEGPADVNRSIMQMVDKAA